MYKKCIKITFIPTIKGPAMNQVFEPQTQPLLYALYRAVRKSVLDSDVAGIRFGDTDEVDYDDLHPVVNGAIKKFVSHPITAQYLVSEFLGAIPTLDSKIFPDDWDLNISTLYDLVEQLVRFPIIDAIKLDPEFTSKTPARG